VRVEVKGQAAGPSGHFAGSWPGVRVDLTRNPGSNSDRHGDRIHPLWILQRDAGGAVSNAEVNDLPLNGRNYQALLACAGRDVAAGRLAVDAEHQQCSSDETVWLVDGIPTLILRRRSIAIAEAADGYGVDSAIDAIQEFNVMESPKAEYGWKPGAQVNVGVRRNNTYQARYAFGVPTASMPQRL